MIFEMSNVVNLFFVKPFDSAERNDAAYKRFHRISKQIKLRLKIRESLKAFSNQMNRDTPLIFRRIRTNRRKPKNLGFVKTVSFW